MKQIIRLTESDLNRIIHECVKKTLNEAGHLYWKDEDGSIYTNSKDLWHGVEGAIFISHGEWSDPEVIYKCEEINGSWLEDSALDYYKYECEEQGKEPSEEEYDNLPASWFKEYLDYVFLPAYHEE